MSVSLLPSQGRSLGDLIVPSNKPAFRSPGRVQSISYVSLWNFVNKFTIPLPATNHMTPRTVRGKPVVCIALPNGPVLAAISLAVANRYIAAPVNCDKAVGLEQFQADVLKAGAACILVDGDDVDRLRLSGASSWAVQSGISVFVMDYSDNARRLSDGVLDTLVITELNTATVTSVSTSIAFEPQPEPNRQDDDIAIILFTSGTSGTKKIVPITVRNIITGVEFVVKSWDLGKDDVCLNMMPLFHIGGLIRNIFSPLFSGGSVICSPAFDPNLFWDVVEEEGDNGPTWYYASPSMHQMILDQTATRPHALTTAQSRIRMVCNAAGGLLPALAYRIRDCFQCIVLPSYGMTECMPISTPPAKTYQLERPGTSGTSAGPELQILNAKNQTVPACIIGRICVRGEPVFHGYLTSTGELDTSCFTDDGWFDTGDLGYLDTDGYLFITGRSKEVINRGGELISPFEVEQAIIDASQTPESPIYNRISRALAFSVPHDVLQEVVGVILVTPPQSRKADLRQLREALMNSLQQAKHPTLVVYMDDVPKRNNKVLRIGLSARLHLPELTDQTKYCELHWNAVCPAPDTELTTDIPSSIYQVDQAKVSRAIHEEFALAGAEHDIVQNEQSGTLKVYVAPVHQILNINELEIFQKRAEAAIRQLKERLPSLVDGLLVPSKYVVLEQPIPRDADGHVDKQKLESIVDSQMERGGVHREENTTEDRVAAIFASILGCPITDIPRDRDFLLIGGDSLKAGKLLSTLRSTFAVHVPIELVFRSGSVHNIASYLEPSQPLPSSSNSSTTAIPKLPPSNPNSSKPIPRPLITTPNPHSSTNPLLLLVQLLPITLFYPLRRAAQWTIFLYALTYTKTWPLSTASTTPGRLLNIVLSGLLARGIVAIISPLIGIAAKWIIIYRHREGVHPMWGLYHTRWWLTQKMAVDICGMGAFDLCNVTRVWYYRLLGAKMGRGVEMGGLRLEGEWDLVEIGDWVVLDERGTHVRPFAVERGTYMYLGRIVVGKGASLGPGSILAPGTVVPEGYCMGANSSSWEVDDGVVKGGGGDTGSSCLAARRPHCALDLFGTLPILLLARVIRAVPWLLGLVGMVLSHPLNTLTPVISIIHWFTGVERVLYHYLAVCLHVVVGPVFLFGVVLVVKFVFDRILGPAKLGPAEGFSQIEKWRICLIKDVFPESALHGLTSLFGQHYEMTSRILRLLGARVGRRVYWPGTGPTIGDYHLVEVGDDVVFGSRANLVTSDGLGSERIVVKDRAMIADRVTLLPGVTVGEDTVLGSGAVTKSGKIYSSGGVYIGSKRGDAVCLSSGDRDEELAERPLSSQQKVSAERSTMDTPLTMGTSQENPDPEKAMPPRRVNLASSEQISTRTHTTPPTASNQTTPASTPFGRAFYLGQAPYVVLGQIPITLYCITIKVLTTIYWNTPFIASVQILSRIHRHHKNEPPSSSSATFLTFTESTLHPLVIFTLLTLSFSLFITLQSLLALCIVIASKWLLLGRRQPGTYTWDTSSYCQRWQIFLAIEALRRECFRGRGILGLLTGTHYMVVYFRAMGAEIGRDCALFANGAPGLLFTEPDLVRMGERVGVDDASLVGHVNTRGRFEMNLVRVGDGCVMRSGTRLLSGGVLERGSCLMEHSLVMGGEVVGEGRTVQGWPAEGAVEVVDFVVGED